MNYKAVLMDMDGVLVLSEPAHYKAWTLTSEELNLTFFMSMEEMIGRTDNEVAVVMIDNNGLNHLPEELCLRKSTHFMRIAEKGLPILEGMETFLKSYYGKTAIAVVSSSIRNEIELILKANKVLEFFKFYIGYEDVVNHKPNPEPYLKAMEMLNVRPHETLIIEDSPTGVKAGKQSGAVVIGLNSSGLLSQSDGVRLFNNYREIIEWLPNSNNYVFK